MFALACCTLNHLKTWLILALFYLFVLASITRVSLAAEHKVPPPASLIKSELSSESAAISLLNNTAFNQQLVALATNLPADTVNSQTLFNRVALLSVLNQHHALLALLDSEKNGISYSHYRLFHEALKQHPEAPKAVFTDNLREHIKQKINKLNNESLYQLQDALGWSVQRALDYVVNLLKQYKALPSLNEEQVISLVTNVHLYHVLKSVIPVSSELIAAENQHRYRIEPARLVKLAGGVELTLTIVQPKQSATTLPTAMQFTIYADERSHLTTAIHAASHGYVGVIANSRGKRLSSNAITPWEHEGEDAAAVIEWISHQPWSNGDVVMYGGSYNGFTQWAAAKHMPKALKAIAPYAAASLITGLPYENNIVLTANYEWAFHVTNNKTMDDTVYADWAKRNELLSRFYQSGLPITKLPELDGKPNPWWQRWMAHPDFDKYYQSMVPVGEEYRHITIPVLTVTGYFDGGQISALDYLKRHQQFNPDADHRLLIGPYSHGTAQGKVWESFSNYTLDPVALDKDTEELVFGWFDHLLFNKKIPTLLSHPVNYQLMGSNQWRHAESLAGLNSRGVQYYLGTTQLANGQYRLLTRQEHLPASIEMTVDMADRTTQRNVSPWPLIQDKINDETGLVYVTEAFTSPMELAGAITGNIVISTNKQDVDIGYNFYAISAEGEVFHLNTYRSRASYAHSMQQRQLLTPGKKTSLPIVNARMTAKLLEPGSRLAIVLNVNKNQDAQVNHGSGKPVNAESSADAGEPLTIEWHNDTQIMLPLKPWSNQ